MPILHLVGTLSPLPETWLHGHLDLDIDQYRSGLSHDISLVHSRDTAPNSWTNGSVHGWSGRSKL